ncbi:MAG TPA: recombinase A [Kofleriaceae bacterium]|nr:recombinase A [Kofleriaceae bacterium]
MTTADVKAFLDRARASSTVAAADGARVLSLDDLRAARVVPAPRWSLDELTGRMTELSGQGSVASLTAAVALVVEAQERGEPAAWVTLPPASFYPPDLADAGVDLDALVVVRAPDPVVIARVADRLLRSGGFGLVVLDLGPAGAEVTLPIPVQGRLVGLAQHHDAALVIVTDKPAAAPSLGSMVSLRAEAVRERTRDGFRVALRACKDKRRGPGWSEVAEVRVPPGLK